MGGWVAARVHEFHACQHCSSARSSWLQLAFQADHACRGCVPVRPTTDTGVAIPGGCSLKTPVDGSLKAPPCRAQTWLCTSDFGHRYTATCGVVTYSPSPERYTNVSSPPWLCTSAPLLAAPESPAPCRSRTPARHLRQGLPRLSAEAPELHAISLHHAAYKCLLATCSTTGNVASGLRTAGRSCATDAAPASLQAGAPVVGCAPPGYTISGAVPP